jgi:dimethylamine monooxygenase subunit A
VDPARWPPGLDDDQLAAATWWRTEHQTFIPVPSEADAPRQAVFTILVNVTPLTQAFDDPAQAARVHDALASMTDAVLAYRGLTAARPALLRWLARRAGGRPA